MARLQENDILFAYKALNIMPGLSSNTRRVAGLLIDHFNRKTGQCDPSISRLARILDIDPATVKRATAELCSDDCGLFEKVSHGGLSHRASYLPNWARFREFVTDLGARMKTGEGPAKGAKLRCSRAQNCAVKGRKTAPQTNLINQSNKPICTLSTESQYAKPRVLSPAETMNGLLKGNKPPGAPTLLLPINGGKSVSKGKAAWCSAERRWDQDIRAFGEAKYADCIERMTPALMQSATQAEMERRGSGALFVLEALDYPTGGQRYG